MTARKQFIKSNNYKIFGMIKKMILDILDYLRYQVYNDKCTDEELRSIYASMSENMRIDATAEDIADFYSVSENSVRNLPQRKPVPKPKRKVYYDFASVVRHKPESWNRNIEK